MEKRKDTFVKWQNNNQDSRGGIISSYLESLLKNQVKVRDVTALASLVAEHLTVIERKNRPCHKSTLLRNKRYREKLDNYQSGIIENGASSIDENKINDPTAKAVIMASRAKVANMRREINRINIYTKSLEERLESFSKNPRVNAIPNELVRDKNSDNAMPELEYRFVRTSQVLRNVLAYFNEIVEVNVEMCSILDRSKRRNNVIVNGDVVKPFFEWLSSVSD